MANDLNKKIATRAEDYSQWYLDIIEVADLAENSPVRGCMIIKPNGYALWETAQRFLDAEFKKTGVKNAYFPLFIPEKFLKKEESHVEGFAPEVALVTHAGGKKLEEPLVVRPTSETIMYAVFSDWIKSYRDLPLLINQWANVVRWEMRTRPFLRTTEFLWQEGHTVHISMEEADARARQMLEVYAAFAEKMMAIPVIRGMKSESEKFAGALHTYTLEAMMQDGKALQYATSHNLGQNFAKVFDVQYLDEQNTMQYGWQTSWGLSTRTIGGLIMTHSDDKGLVLPPRMASTQVIITTVGAKDENRAELNEKAEGLKNGLIAAGIRAETDIRDIRPGEKFFEWEKKGIPIRLEFGPKDLVNNQVVAVRRDKEEKQSIQLNMNEGAGSFTYEVQSILDQMQIDLFQKALALQKERTHRVDTWEDFKSEIANGNMVLAHWSGDATDEAKIKEETGASIRCIPFDQPEEEGECVYSKKPSKKRVLFALAY